MPTPADYMIAGSRGGGGGFYSPPTVSYAPSAAGGASAGGTGANVSSAGNITDITNLINNLNRQAQSQANLNRIPGEANLETQSSADIGSELSGTLPADVQRQLAETSAEMGVSTGTNPNADYLRGLGLTSLDLTNQGQANLTAATARNPAAPLFDPTTQLLTPYQAGELGTQAGELQLDQQTEADRVALEQAQLAQQASAQAQRAALNQGGGTTTQPSSPWDTFQDIALNSPNYGQPDQPQAPFNWYGTTFNPYSTVTTTGGVTSGLSSLGYDFSNPAYGAFATPGSGDLFSNPQGVPDGTDYGSTG